MFDFGFVSCIGVEFEYIVGIEKKKFALGIEADTGPVAKARAV